MENFLGISPFTPLSPAEESIKAELEEGAQRWKLAQISPRQIHLDTQYRMWGCSRMGLPYRMADEFGILPTILCTPDGQVWQPIFGPTIKEHPQFPTVLDLILSSRFNRYGANISKWWPSDNKEAT